jgi:hypothetical protein
MSTKSREYTYGTMIRLSAERAKEARRKADRLACEAWNFRMLGYKGPAQPSPTLGDALNAGLALKNLVIISELPSSIGRNAQSPFEGLSSLIPFLIQGGPRRVMRDADARHGLRRKAPN